MKISDFLRDSIAQFSKEDASVIASALSAITELSNLSDELDAEVRTKQETKQKLLDEIAHFQERIQAYAIERANYERVTPQMEKAESDEEDRKRREQEFLHGI